MSHELFAHAQYAAEDEAAADASAQAQYEDEARQEEERMGGEDHAALLGLVRGKDEQASGDLLAHLPCPVFTAALFDTLAAVKERCITGPEQRAVDDCATAVRALYARFGGEVP
jgi:hypothetical protein